MPRITLALIPFFALCIGTTLGDEAVGRRPYEMDWAGRTADARPPSVDFENLDGWGVAGVEAEASFERSRQQQLWGDYVGSLVYRGAGQTPVVTIKPPEPIPVPAPFDCVNLWVYGNNWNWIPDPGTPQVEIAVLLRGGNGSLVRVVLGRVNWQEWWLMHRKLNDNELALLREGASFEAIEVSGGRNVEDRMLYFDNLAFYQEELPPLEFDKRPARPFDPCPDGTPGLNVGPERLPFPTRPETILPENLATEFETSLAPSGDGFAFHYRGPDGHLVYRYTPSTGTLNDLSAAWEGRGGEFQPLDSGGVRFHADAGRSAVMPEKMELIGCRREGDRVESEWRAMVGQRAATVQYTFELMQKSMVVTIRCGGGEVGEVGIGKAVGLERPRLVTIPFLPGYGPRPAVVVAGGPETPLFISAFLDHYVSNASAFWFVNFSGEEGAVYNGGSRYEPKTDGRRNNCYERLFLTVSPRFEETLPTVANPKSPWMNVTGERVWIAYGASNRQHDYDFWKKVARHRMTNVLITDHETGWRDGGESFTFRTRAAPGKGGDEGQADYARKLRALGFRYGIYNQYCDYATVNEHWDEDNVTRTPDGQWQTGWPRCYNPKPARAVEFEARLAPIIQEKFQLDTAYCDVHTSVAPWSYVDYDARVPRAGTFGATFYAYGEIMLDQKKNWNGPVYSEGGNHWYYCGLTDGNYGQDQAAQLNTNPWLVDFDLRKLHPLCCNFGMGNPEMFFGAGQNLGHAPEEREARLDRFLAATLAFGHTGFLVLDGGMPNAVRSYFSLQQVHAAYAQATAAEIRYADARGRLLDTSAAVATEAYRRSQIVTRYDNELVVTVNGHPSESWQTDDMLLPPNGWHVHDSKDGRLVAWSATVDGHRADYVDSPAYIYANGRGRFTRFEKAACDGQLIAHRRDDGAFELIPVGACREFGIAIDGKTATAEALDAEEKSLGPAETRFSRGVVYVSAAPNAFSYVVRPAEGPAVSLRCDRDRVVPGETVQIAGKTQHAFQVPPDAMVGSRIWQSFDDAWIDFTVVPLVDASIHVDGKIILQLASHLSAPADAEVAFDQEVRSVRLVPGTPVSLDYPLAELQEGQTVDLPLKVAAGGMTFERNWQITTRETTVPIAKLSATCQVGICLRTGRERPVDGDSGAWASWSETSCGGVKKTSFAMHPPYRTGVGHVSALFEPIDLPAAPAAMFRCDVGKGDGSVPGDGILYRVAVVEPDGRETIVAEKQWVQHAWTPLEADLSPWAGKRVRLKLIADVGHGDNPDGDHACWAETRIESAQPVSRPEIQ